METDEIVTGDGANISSDDLGPRDHPDTQGAIEDSFIADHESWATVKELTHKQRYARAEEQHRYPADDALARDESEKETEGNEADADEKNHAELDPRRADAHFGDG